MTVTHGCKMIVHETLCGVRFFGTTLYICFVAVVAYFSTSGVALNYEELTAEIAFRLRMLSTQ